MRGQQGSESPGSDPRRQMVLSPLPAAHCTSLVRGAEMLVPRRMQVLARVIACVA